MVRFSPFACAFQEEEVLRVRVYGGGGILMSLMHCDHHAIFSADGIGDGISNI